MIKKKHTGSYYTPEFLSKFILEYIAPSLNGQDNISILEPSVGDGSFIKAFNQTVFPDSIKSYSFKAVEKINTELKKAEAIASESCNKKATFTFINEDFLNFQDKQKASFSVIVGNPPYIKKSLLNANQIALCQKIHSAAALKKASVKNIWPSFLIRCSELLLDNGVLSFILPAELLQVNFASELRHYLVDHFQRIEIFTFDDLLFECKGQDTILLIAFKQHNTPGQFYSHITNTEQLNSKEFVLTTNTGLASTETKWSHHLLSSDELTFIHNVGRKVNSINSYCDSKPGIVTGANDFFIVDNQTESFYNLTNYVKPIIQKGFFVNGSVVFDENELNKIIKDGKPAKIFSVLDKDASALPSHVQSYLQAGELAELPKAYKCSKRQNWFVVPNIGDPPDGFFFRRVHHYPKLLKNNAKVLVTDTAYKIDMKSDFNIESLIYSFYNSLSLTFTELNGRYFGGGVLELTPSEFKKIPVPYFAISSERFVRFRNTFEQKNEISDVLTLNDTSLLSQFLNISAEDVEKIQSIRLKLVSKRFRE